MTYSIKYENFSPTTWTRSLSGSSIDAVLQNLNKLPGPHLQAHSGLEEIEADQSILSFIATGAIDLYCCWFDPTTTQRFGIQLWVPLQVFDIGPAPYWYVMSDSQPIGAPVKWISSGNDAASQFNFNVNGFKINARPVAGHSSLDITVKVEKA